MPSPTLLRPDTLAPGSTAQGGIAPSPKSTFTPVHHKSPTPSPSPFYDFTGYRLEEHSFLACAMKLELLATFNLWPHPWALNTPGLNKF